MASAPELHTTQTEIDTDVDEKSVLLPREVPVTVTAVPVTATAVVTPMTDEKHSYKTFPYDPEIEKTLQRNRLTDPLEGELKYCKTRFFLSDAWVMDLETKLAQFLATPETLKRGALLFKEILPVVKEKLEAVRTGCNTHWDETSSSPFYAVHEMERFYMALVMTGITLSDNMKSEPGLLKKITGQDIVPLADVKQGELVAELVREKTRSAPEPSWKTFPYDPEIEQRLGRTTDNYHSHEWAYCIEQQSVTKEEYDRHVQIFKTLNTTEGSTTKRSTLNILDSLLREVETYLDQLHTACLRKAKDNPEAKSPMYAYHEMQRYHELIKEIRGNVQDTIDYRSKRECPILPRREQNVACCCCDIWHFLICCCVPACTWH